MKVNTKVYSTIDPELRETGRYVLKLWKKFNGNHSLNGRSPQTKSTQADTDDRTSAVEMEAA